MELTTFNKSLQIQQAKIGNDTINAVNARDLWRAIESKQQFADWIKARIEKLQLQENTDFITLRNQENKGFGGNVKSVDYVITLDIAKHFAMLEMTDIGRKVRQYFIECEKQLRRQFKAPANMIEALELALEQQKQIVAQEKQITEQKQVIAYQENKLDGYKEIEKSRRSKETLAKKLNQYIRTIAQQKFNNNYKEAYRYIYGIFGEKHFISDKINMDFLRKNIDYLHECVEIALSEMD